MRIVFVTSEYITEKGFDGGLANYLGRVCPLLVKMGHTVMVVVASNHEGVVTEDGVEVHRVCVNEKAQAFLNRVTRWRLKSVLSWVMRSWAYRRVCRKIHQEKPVDIIQYASFSATALFRLKNVPAVVRLSSYEPYWQKAYSWPSSLDHRLRSLLEKLALKKADAVFGPSQLIAEKVKEVIDKPVEVIEPPFSMSCEDWDDKKYKELLADKNFLLFVGTLGELKGAHTIADIIYPFLKNNPNLSFVFIGKDFGYRGRPTINHIREHAAEFRDRVVYMGQMRQAELYPILSNAVAVVLPSLIDNLPNACIEAMATGRIVIGTKGASFEQLIEDGVSGFLCPPGAPDELLQVINKSLSMSATEMKEMGQSAAERIDQLRPEKTIKKLTDFYDSVIYRL